VPAQTQKLSRLPITLKSTAAFLQKMAETCQWKFKKFTVLTGRRLMTNFYTTFSG
jgi:hypothetical protein